MRIFFAVPRSFNPKQMYREYPLGVGFLGTILKQQGHEVRIYDENIEGTEDAVFLARVAAFQPDVVGFSVITPNYPVARRQIHQLRELYPSLWMIAGGVHASLFPEDLVQDGVNAVVLGEGEPVIVPLLKALSEGGDLSGINGLVYRTSSGDTVRNPGRSQNVSLDDLPVVDRSLYNLSRYNHHSMVASRGCPHACAFCCNYTGTVRGGVAVRQFDRVIGELEHLRDAYGAREVFFVDDIFMLRKRDILEFCRGCAARQLGMRWIAQMRADRVDAEVAEAMKAGGCQRIYFGVESGSDEVLRNASKGMTRAQLSQGIAAAKKAGIRVKTGWIYGLPGTLSQQYESIDFMLEMRPHEISIHQLIPFPGTIYYDQPARFGIRIADPKSFESFCYGGIDGDIQFDYLSQSELVQLVEDTGRALEAEGYVSSDKAVPGAEFVYTTPLSKQSMTVFRPVHA